MSYGWNMQALILSRLDKINQDEIELLASDGKVTANRTILRLVSSPVHTKLVENPDLTILTCHETSQEGQHCKSPVFGKWRQSSISQRCL